MRTVGLPYASNVPATRRRRGPAWALALLLGCAALLGATLHPVAVAAAPGPARSAASVRNSPASTAPAPPAEEELTPDERNTIAVFQRAAPSVVAVINHQVVRQPFSTQQQEQPVGTGSGFIIGAEGTLLTNAHVVEDASSLTVILADHTELEATVVGIAADKDVALLRVDPPAGGLAALPLGSSEHLLVGQKVLAIGNPYGLDHTLTVGVISALNRETQAPTGRTIRGVIQTDAPINPGNSGGPLLNSRGEVIGMNSAIVSETGSNVGIGFAVPVGILRKLIPELSRYGKARRPVLGIGVADDSFADALDVPGVIVVSVQPGSDAERAGLQPMKRGEDGSVLLGDVIQRIDDVTVETRDDLLHALEQHAPGESVTVHTHYHGADRSFRIVLRAQSP